MMKRSWIGPAGLAMALPLMWGAAGAEVPPRTAAGQALQVPEEQLDMGFVYHVQPGEDTQLLAVSRAPLQRVALTAGRIVGYVVVPFDLEDASSPLLAGAFRLPVADLRTGAPAVDESLRSPAFLDRAAHPEIGFEIQAVEDLKRVSASAEETRFELTIRGTLAVKETTRELAIPAKLRFLPSSMRAMARNVGDLAFLEATFQLSPADFGWEPPSPLLRERIGGVIDCDLFLTFNTITPDKSGDPRDDPVVFAKQQGVLTLLRDLDDPDAGYASARVLMEEIWDDGKELSRLAESIAFAPGIASRRLDLGLKAARRASELADHGDFERLTLTARILHAAGDLSGAAQWQRKAVALAPEDGEAAAALERYEAELKKEN